MALDLDGKRPRYFHERMKVEAQQGDPIRRSVSEEARKRLMREVKTLAYQMPQTPGKSWVPFIGAILADMARVFGGYYPEHTLEATAVEMPLENFLTTLEICAKELWLRRRFLSDIQALQSILADDLSAYRFRDVGEKGASVYQIQLIDNEHLHKEIVDRTFELTCNAAFDSAQRDYAEAWKHYSKGDFDDAVVNAHKAFESACKIIVKRLDPDSAPEQKQTNQLIPELLRLDILPAKLGNMVENLRQIFLSSGSLRNAAGAGHGSLDLTGPEADVALMALQMSGTLVSFLARRWEYMKPKA